MDGDMTGQEGIRERAREEKVNVASLLSCSRGQSRHKKTDT